MAAKQGRVGEKYILGGENLPFREALGILDELTGSVLDVNYDRNYVLIDIGGMHNMRPNYTMIVARNDELICKVKTTRVYKKYAVAEILPELNKGAVIAGDRVITR